MTRRAAVATLALASALPQDAHAQLQSPSYVVSPGFLLSYGLKGQDGLSYGAELTAPVVWMDAHAFHTGGLTQWQKSDDSQRVVFGSEVGFSFFGTEAGYALRFDDGEKAVHGFHFAPYLTMGILHLAARFVFWDDGTEYGLTAGVKVPIRYAGAPLLERGHGRPVRRARTRSGALLKRLPGARLPSRAHGALAARWLEHARSEHESVLAFRRLARDLRAQGAPDGLVLRALAAAKEEAEHARRCLHVFEGLSGHACALAAAACDVPAASLPQLAYESWIDGVEGEGEGAAQLLEDAAEAAPAVRDHLHAIAREERGHGQLAADIVAWAERVGGAEVRLALAEAQDTTRPADMPRPSVDRLSRHWGLALVQNL